MNKNKKHLGFIIAILVLIVVVGGLIYQQEKIINNGAVTILKTRPVDPRDLFRGEYVILRYEIENDEKITSEAKEMDNGSILYIKLQEDTNGIAYVDEVTRKKPASYEGLWIIAEINRKQARFPSLEQFYVPEGAGGPIERMRDKLHARVVLSDGKARVIELLDDNLNVIDSKSQIE